jgi:Fe-S cluster assembly protein SufD
MMAVSQQIGNWLEQFTKQEPAESWLQKLRENAFTRFTELGFPTTRDEEWRFTNVAPIARTQFQPAVGSFAGAFSPPVGVELLFINGCRIQTELLELPNPLPKGVAVEDLPGAENHLGRYADYKNNAFVALNTAFLGEAAVIRVKRGTVLQRPIEITYQAQSSGAPFVTHPRVLVIVESGAQCSIVESYQGSGRPGAGYLTNAVTEIVAGDGAVVDHYKIQRESMDAFHIATLQVALGRSANFTTHNISLGGALVRNDIGVTLAEGSEATVNGLYLVNGTQHVDNHTVIDHAKPHGASHELYKGILDGRASAVFNGRILVRKDAQKTDSKQTNKNLVLSDDAVINTKPELQIFADDVRCTHGATIGQLDAESLFYLQSRGIGKAEARGLLTQAFAQDIIDRIKVPELKDQLEKVLAEKFHERSDH